MWTFKKWTHSSRDWLIVTRDKKRGMDEEYQSREQKFSEMQGEKKQNKTGAWI